MQITVNGENQELRSGMTLPEFLAEAEFRMERCAVEINGKIIKKSLYGGYVIQESDVLEVVTFVGGG